MSSFSSSASVPPSHSTSSTSSWRSWSSSTRPTWRGSITALVVVMLIVQSVNTAGLFASMVNNDVVILSSIETTVPSLFSTPATTMDCGHGSSSNGCDSNSNPLKTVLCPSSLSGETFRRMDLPILPRLETNSSDASMKALERFFQQFPDMAHGGLVHLHELNISKAAELRHLARTIFGRRMACGAPKVLHKNNNQTLATQDDGLEYCFWNGDLVSGFAMQDFGYEREMWEWVVQAFEALSAKQQQQQQQSSAAKNTNNLECLAFLDAGVNVGDWASPIRAALPQVPYFGIEGSPHTAAIAAANMLTSVEHHRRRQHQVHHTNLDNEPSSSPLLPVAATSILPFPLLSWFLLQSAQESGGVCFATYHKNIGGQRIGKASSLNCPPKSSAGATFLPHALRNIKKAYQSSCGGTQSVWPSVYIAKFDIQGFEFRALTSAIEWLQQRPPCYLLFEVTPGSQQNYALMELVSDLGYDAVWRTSDPSDPSSNQPVEFPGQTEAWWQAGKSKNSLAEAFEADMEGRTKAQYKNYLFGFQDEEACIQRLLDG